MRRYLTVVEVLNLHRQVIEQFGGALGIRNLDALESAVAQPKMVISVLVTQLWKYFLF